MTNEPALAWRATLREDLRTGGPLALRMLAGARALDVLVLLPTLQAAGLLDAATCGDDALRALRADVLRAAAANRDVVDDAVRQVDLAVGLVDAEDRVDALHRLVALAGLANALPPGAARDAVDDALLVEDAEIALADLDDADLRAAAEWLAAALDLDADHPASALLTRLAERAPEAPEGAFEAGMRGAKATLFPSMLTRWAEWFDGAVAAWLDAIAPAPAVAHGAAGELPPVTPRRLIHRDATAEVCLVAVGETLAVEWCGDGPPPEHARLGDRVLTALPSLVPDSRVWSLGEAPGDGAPGGAARTGAASGEPLAVELTGPAGSLRVVLR